VPEKSLQVVQAHPRIPHALRIDVAQVMEPQRLPRKPVDERKIVAQLIHVPLDRRLGNRHLGGCARQLREVLVQRIRYRHRSGFLSLCRLGADVDPPGLEIDVGPLETGHLRFPESREDPDHDHGEQSRVTGRLIDDLGYLAPGQPDVPDVLFVYLQPLARVAADIQFVPDRPVHEAAQDVDVLVDRRPRRLAVLAFVVEAPGDVAFDVGPAKIPYLDIVKEPGEALFVKSDLSGVLLLAFHYPRENIEVPLEKSEEQGVLGVILHDDFLHPPAVAPFCFTPRANDPLPDAFALVYHVEHVLHVSAGHPVLAWIFLNWHGFLL